MLYKFFEVPHRSDNATKDTKGYPIYFPNTNGQEVFRDQEYVLVISASDELQPADRESAWVSVRSSGRVYTFTREVH